MHASVSEIEHKAAADDTASADRELGQRIRSLRQSKRLSLRIVSSGAGVSEGFLSQVERGKAIEQFRSPMLDPQIA